MRLTCIVQFVLPLKCWKFCEFIFLASFLFVLHLHRARFLIVFSGLFNHTNYLVLLPYICYFCEVYAILIKCPISYGVFSLGIFLLFFFSFRRTPSQNTCSFSLPTHSVCSMHSLVVRTSFRGLAQSHFVAQRGGFSFPSLLAGKAMLAITNISNDAARRKESNPT